MGPAFLQIRQKLGKTVEVEQRLGLDEFPQLAAAIKGSISSLVDLLGGGSHGSS